MRVLNIGLAGLGNAGFQVHGEVLQHMQEVRLHAASDPVAPLREEAARRYGCRTYATFDELLDDPAIDAVTIATPHRFHCEMGLRALDAGKHVLVEKAMCLNAEEASTMLAAARRAGRVLTVYQNWRHMPDAHLVHDVIASDALGRVRRIESRVLWLPYRSMGENGQMWGTPADSSWMAQRTLGGGSLLMFGPHLVDQLLFTIGYQPSSVRATVQSIVGQDDYVRAELMSDDQSLAEVEMNLAAFTGTKGRWLVLGTEGTLYSDGRGTLVVKRHDEQEPRTLGVPPPHEHGNFFTTGSQLYLNLRNAIFEGAPLEVQPAQALTLMRVLDAIRDAAETGQAVGVSALEAAGRLS